MTTYRFSVFKRTLLSLSFLSLFCHHSLIILLATSDYNSVSIQLLRTVYCLDVTDFLIVHRDAALLPRLSPTAFGGGMVDRVSREGSTYAGAPAGFYSTMNSMYS